jgi:Bacterial protein of unknown function (DUF899)
MGVSAFALDDSVAYHTYSAYARGVDAVWGAYQWLDRTFKRRNETAYWFRRPTSTTSAEQLSPGDLATHLFRSSLPASLIGPHFFVP